MRASPCGSVFLFHRLWGRTVAPLLAGLGLAVSLAWAQDTPGPSAPVIEMWHGNKRSGDKGTGAGNSPAPLASKPPSSPAPTLKPITEPDYVRQLPPLRAVMHLPDLPPAPPPPLPRPRAPEQQGPAPKPPCASEESVSQRLNAVVLCNSAILRNLSACAGTVREALVQLQAVSGSMSQAAEPTGSAERQENAEPSPQAPPAAIPSRPGNWSCMDRPAGEPSSVSLSWNQFFWLQMPLTIGAVVLTPLLMAIGLALVLRRSGLRFRIELTGAPGVPLLISGGRVETGNSGSAEGLAPGTLSPLAGTTAGGFPPQQLLPEEQELELTGEHFDLGPSYEEEKLAQEESHRHQELAVLEKIFTDNCQLMQEIQELAEVEPGPEEEQPEG